MINIYFTKVESKFTSCRFDSLLNLLPESFRVDILKYKREQDRHLSLIGKLLLKFSLGKNGYGHLKMEDLRYTDYKRPYFLNETADFNISHSDEYVICGIADGIKLGLDIEKQNVVDILEFREIFSKREWEVILKTPDGTRKFYEMWTKKEAVLKAVGVGISYPLQNINVIDGPVFVDNSFWFVKEICIARNYSCHVATDRNTDDILIEKVDFDDKTVDRDIIWDGQHRHNLHLFD